MTWDAQHEFLFGLVLLVSASVSMIFVAVMGYFVARWIFQIWNED